MVKPKEGKGLFRGISKNVLALGGVSCLNDISSDMIYPLLPIFLTSVLGVGTAFLGLIEGIAESTASILKLLSGWYSDRVKNRKGLVVGGYSLAVLVRPLLAASTSGWHVLLIRFSDRVGKGVRTSARDSLIADSCPEHSRGKAFGFHRAMDNLGAVVGPLLAAGLLAFMGGDLRLLFLLASIPGFLAVAILLGFVRDRPRPLPEPQTAPSLTLRGFDRGFKAYLIVLALFTLGNSSDAFLMLRARDLGVPLAQIPLLWVALHVVKTLSSMPGGMLSDRVGRRGVISAGWFIYAAAYLGFALAGSARDIWLFMGVYGLFFGLTEGVEKAYVADLIPSERKGTAYGAYNFAIGIFQLPASLLMGALWWWLGAPFAFAFGAGLALAAAGALWLFVPARRAA